MAPRRQCTPLGIASAETDQKRQVVLEEDGELTSQRATSLRQENFLRENLEKQAQSSHERTLTEREDNLKSEGEVRHAASMQHMQSKVEASEVQLKVSFQKNKDLEEALQSKSFSLALAEGNLARLRAGKESLGKIHSPST